jgi:hypothetical protein
VLVGIKLYRPKTTSVRWMIPLGCCLAIFEILQLPMAAAEVRRKSVDCLVTLAGSMIMLYFAAKRFHVYSTCVFRR